MKKANKYNYFKVIQGNYGTGWNDEDFHQVNSSFCFDSAEKRSLFRTNLKAYRVNGGGLYRVINRRELNEAQKDE